MDFMVKSVLPEVQPDLHGLHIGDFRKGLRVLGCVSGGVKNGCLIRRWIRIHFAEFNMLNIEL